MKSKAVIFTILTFSSALITSCNNAPQQSNLADETDPVDHTLEAVGEYFNGCLSADAKKISTRNYVATTQELETWSRADLENNVPAVEDVEVYPYLPDYEPNTLDAWDCHDLSQWIEEQRDIKESDLEKDPERTGIRTIEATNEFDESGVITWIIYSHGNQSKMIKIEQYWSN